MKSLLRGFTINYAELNSEDSDPLLRPQVFTASVTDVADRFANAIQQVAGWQIESREQVDETICMHLTRRTRIFRFVDDIQVKIEPHEPAAAIVYAHSQSRLGKGDLGQNRRNLRELNQTLIAANGSER